MRLAAEPVGIMPTRARDGDGIRIPADCLAFDRQHLLNRTVQGVPTEARRRHRHARTPNQRPADPVKAHARRRIRADVWHFTVSCRPDPRAHEPPEATSLFVVLIPIIAGRVLRYQNDAQI